ncbi:MAG: hypothetical protein HY320_02930 [Armatimonadetes bacterium]|nr:hypothetical protein [Armatimonadota bacterium]
MHVTWKKGVAFREAALKENIQKKGGYRYRWAAVTAEGTVTRWQDLPALRASGTGQIFLLQEDPSCKGNTPGALQRLLQATGSGKKTVEVTGRAYSRGTDVSPDTPPGIIVYAFKPE